LLSTWGLFETPSSGGSSLLRIFAASSSNNLETDESTTSKSLELRTLLLSGLVVLTTSRLRLFADELETGHGVLHDEDALDELEVPDILNCSAIHWR